jgi:hypothetical protein
MIGGKNSVDDMSRIDKIKLLIFLYKNNLDLNFLLCVN